MFHDKKVKIKNMISNIKDKVILKEIFLLIQHELKSNGCCKYTHNSNGIFFDLNHLSCEKILQIEEIITNANNTETESIKLSLYSNDSNEYVNISNKDKFIINNIQKDKQ